MTKFKTCACAKCKSFCQNPGWFTPEEATAAIAAGYADRLMMDYWVRDPDNIYVLCPASRHCEKDRAPNTQELSMFRFSNPSKGRCVLQSADGLCSIHESGFKPLQCRVADCGGGFIDNTEMGLKWDNPEAQIIVRKWMAMVGLDESTLEECF